jgi:four helix bundle protein
MALGRERLDVYRLAITCVAWVYEKAATLEGVHRAARDQWLRASQSIPLNIAEGNGKTADADRRRYFEIARGSALECAAIQDVLVVGKALEEGESQNRKTELDRMAAMLSRLGGRGYQVREEATGYDEAGRGIDPDPDSDSDLDETKPQQGAAPAVAGASSVER